MNPSPATKSALAPPMARALFVAGPGPMSLVLWTLSYVQWPCPMSYAHCGRHNGPGPIGQADVGTASIEGSPLIAFP